MNSVRVVHQGEWTYPGGAERVAREIARVLGANMTVGHTTDRGFWDGLDVDFPFQHLEDGILNRLPKQVRELYVGLLFRTLDFEEDIVISSGTTAKWWTPQTDQRHIHYCHSPPEQIFVHGASGLVESLMKTGVGMIDRFYVQMCDKILSNSEFTASRVETYYGLESEVVHPPIGTEKFRYEDPDPDTYFVMIGRLNEMKRVDLVAEAFRDLDHRLVLVGDGPLHEQVEEIPDVTVHEYLSDEELVDLVARSTGGIAFAEKEHCGMTPKEFQAAGKPVLVPNEPNLCNHVNESNGVVVDPSIEGVRRGIQEILCTIWETDLIQRSARNWSLGQFHEEIVNLVAENEKVIE